jgi:hypothetical protein
VVKHVDAVELRVVAAAVLAVAADAVLVAQNLLKIGAHLVTINSGGTRACIPNGKTMILPLYLLCFQRRAKHSGCSRVR